VWSTPNFVNLTKHVDSVLSAGARDRFLNLGGEAQRTKVFGRALLILPPVLASHVHHRPFM
jgi:hypothetical protein